MTESKEAVRACPFCDCPNPTVMWVDWAYRVVCVPPTEERFIELCGPGGNGCGAHGPRHETEEGAIRGWNRRPPTGERE